MGQIVTAIEIVAATATAVYAVCIALMSVVWLKSRAASHGTPGPPAMSVVVAVHNESANIGRLIESLCNQTQPIDEIIIVLDHCTDDTEAQAKKASEGKIQRIVIIHNKRKPGKKQAQRTGVETARNKYVGVTDGDCTVGKRWHETIARWLNENKCDVVIMPVAMKANDSRLTQQLMELEFTSLQLVTAATALYGRPTMCNGANMVFERELYLNHTSRDEYASGDDMFLLSAAKQQGKTISYLKSTDAVVATACPPSIKSYLRQRTRWLRKSTGYTDTDVKLLAALVAAGNAGWPLALGCALITGTHTLWITCLALKTLAETALIASGRRDWGTRANPIDISMLALCYPVVLGVIALLSTIRDKTKW